MKEPFLSLARKMKFFSTAKEPYKNLRKHFNAQAVGYPATLTGIELSRCQMEAISFKPVEKKKMATAIDPKRCIGCELCVASCKTGSITLRKKEIEFIPPKDHDALYETIMQKKKGPAGKIGMITKAMMGMKV